MRRTLGTRRTAIVTGRLRAANQSELMERRHAVVQSNLLCDLTVLQPQDRHSSESHHPTGRLRQGSREEVAVRRTGMCATAFPATDHVVAVGDEVAGSPEVEIGKRFTEDGDEL